MYWLRMLLENFLIFFLLLLKWWLFDSIVEKCNFHFYLYGFRLILSMPTYYVEVFLVFIENFCVIECARYVLTGP